MTREELRKKRQEIAKNNGYSEYKSTHANQQPVTSKETSEKRNVNFGRGNIDLNNRPVVKNSDGSISTVRSMSFYDDNEKKEILVPTVVNGKIVSDDEAINHYYNTGEYLGKFDTVDEANNYAERLHEQQEKYYGNEQNQQKMSTWDKVMNIAKSMGTDVGNIGKNFGLGVTSAVKNSGYYIQDMTENKFGDYRRYNQQQNAILNKKEESEKLTKDKGTVNINDVKLPENPNQRQIVSEEESKKALLPQKQESRVLKSIDESIAKDEEKIQQNIDNSSNRVSKKLAELMPSIAQSVTGMGASAVNPAIRIRILANICWRWIHKRSRKEWLYRQPSYAIWYNNG